MPRLFYALPLPPATGADLHRALKHVRSRMHDLPGIRWVPGANLHLTVLFLGEVKKEMVEGFLSRGRNAASRIPPFELEFLAFEVSYRNRRPAMIWARYRLHASFLQLFEELATDSAARIAVDPTPHVTLARIRQLKHLPEPLPEGGSYPFTVRRLELWNSVTDPGGARYSPVAGWELGWKNFNP